MLFTDAEDFNYTILNAPIGICILNADTLVAEIVNDKFLEVAGKPYNAIYGQYYWDAFAEVRSNDEAALATVVATGETYYADEVELMLIRYGKPEMIFVTFVYAPVKNKEGKVKKVAVWVLENTRQVTERKKEAMMRIQEELREVRRHADQQRRVYEAIASGTPDLMYVWDLQYRFIYANSALLNMWGKTWDTAIGKGLRENGYEEWHAAMHEREIDHVVATKESVRGEVAFPHAVLGNRIYDYILIPVFNEAGEVEAVAGTTRDVTDRKEMEQTLAQSSEELQAINEELLSANEEQAASNEELIATNEELAIVNQQLRDAWHKIEEREIALRLAVDAANFGTWFIHSVTREFITDARLKELFGYYPEEELSIEQALAQITDEYRDFVSTKLENALYNNGDYDVTYPVIGLHDNRLRWLRAIGNLKADPSGAFSAFTGVVMDITEQKIDEIRKNDFIGMASHELKTPLTSMKGYIQMLIKVNRQNNDLNTDMLEKANSQVGKMTAMINSFLNVSRLESGKIYMEIQEFDLAELIEEAEEETNATISSHIVIFNPVVEPMVVNADRDKIGQVIHNLISNALKYSTAGSTIEVSCFKDKGMVNVSVKDRGMGIKSDDLPNIFDRYYRVEGSQMFSISGFGIGLYLCKEIIERHKGEISAISDFGVGSTFTFSLPLLST
ncbi:ATP-binding protein [Pedobacter frigoris]|nr:ATP-binding protein [Pedobacter frigoris]